MGGERHVLQNATGKSNECQRDGSYGNSFRRWLAGQKLRGGGLCGPRGRHYLCKGVERSLWNCGARLARPYRSSIAQRMLVPPCHPCPPFPSLTPYDRASTSHSFAGGCFKVSGWCGGVMPWSAGRTYLRESSGAHFGAWFESKDQTLSQASQLDLKFLFSFSSILFNA